MLAVAEALTRRGLGVVRYHFPYREQGRRYPDSMPRLAPQVVEVVEFIRSRLPSGRMVVGGRSMGGRATSVAVAEGLKADGLLLLAYPLHAPGRPDRLRDAHLPRVGIPTLCLNGTRDAFCERPKMEAVVAGLAPGWTQCWVEGADHGFHVLKRSGRTDADVLQEVGEVVSKWMSALRSR